MNVAAVLTTLGLYESSSGMPPYGSYVVFEVHNLGDDYGIQVLIFVTKLCRLPIFSVLL